jgi:hypothetical protein
MEVLSGSPLLEKKGSTFSNLERSFQRKSVRYRNSSFYGSNNHEINILMFSKVCGVLNFDVQVRSPYLCHVWSKSKAKQARHNTLQKTLVYMKNEIGAQKSAAEGYTVHKWDMDEFLLSKSQGTGEGVTP